MHPINIPTRKQNLIRELNKIGTGELDTIKELEIENQFLKYELDNAKLLSSKTLEGGNLIYLAMLLKCA